MHGGRLFFITGFMLITSFSYAQDIGNTNPGAMPDYQPPPEVTDVPPAPPPPPPPAQKSTSQGGLSLEEWNRDDWVLMAPKLSLFELDGYFRVRSGMLRNLNLGNNAQWENNGRYTPSSGSKANYSDTNMRLRLDPIINVTEQAQILATVDVLDNLVLGSTPETLHQQISNRTPANSESRTQTAPQKGLNSLNDSILVKRLYARLTALNEQLELRVGRMPDHFGLGLLSNSGNCLDCDYGSVVDRVSATFRLLNHLWTPMFDWISSGPLTTPFGLYDPRPLDAATWDDAVQWSLRITHQMHEDDIAQAWAHGKHTFNYGLHNSVRVQSHDLPASFYSTETPDNTTAPTTPLTQEERKVLIYTGDFFAQWYAGPFQLHVEGIVEAGSFKDAVTLQSGQTGVGKTTVLRGGGALEASYKFSQKLKGLTIGFKAGGASGDEHSGYGALDQADTQRGPGDSALHNFNFSRDYHVDFLMFRRILGSVTSAWYLRPEVSYKFDRRFMGTVAAIYSQAVSKRSTASCALLNGVSDCNAVSGGGSLPMGLELDGELSYGFVEKVHAPGLKGALQAGFLFPFGAFRNPLLSANDQDPSMAWTLQAKMYLTF
jgi:uncharacterized protein (TIGR04551 family)